MTAPAHPKRSPLPGATDGNARAATEIRQLKARIAELEQRLQDMTSERDAARHTVAAEQDAHSATRLLLPRPARSDLDAKVATAVQPIAQVRARQQGDTP